MKKLLILLLCVLTCISSASCSLGAGQPSDSTRPQDTESDKATASPDSTDAPDAPAATPDRLSAAKEEAESALSSAPTGDFDGMSYIFTRMSSAVFGDVSDATVLSREQNDRISLLGERLNVNIIVTEASYEDILSGLGTSESSGMIYSHMLSVNASKIGSLNYAGYLGNFNSLPFIDLSRPYYDADVCAQFATPSGIYAVYGDAVCDYDSLGAVFYNSRIAESFGYDDLEGAVRDGAWTLDLLGACVKSVSSSDNTDIYAIGASSAESMLSRFYISAGMQSAKLASGKLTANNNAEQGDRLAAAVKELLLSFGESYDGISAEEQFFVGECMFYIGRLGEVSDFYCMTDVWGLLPMPTLDGGSSYSTPLYFDTQLICFPKQADASETGIMTENLFACSYKVGDQALRYDFLHKYVRNAKAIEMLGYICSDKSADLVLAYGDEYPKYRDNTIGVFISACESETRYSKAIKKSLTQANKSISYVK